MEANIIQVLKDHGLIITEKRLLIVKAVCKIGLITDVETFWLELREAHPVSWATVHSTLRLMTQYGFLQKENYGTRLVSYQLSMV